MIWTLKAEQIGALNDGSGLILLATPGAAPKGATQQVANALRPTRLTVNAHGFADAVGKSVQPFE
jgi:hypothetical protein